MSTTAFLGAAAFNRLHGMVFIGATFDRSLADPEINTMPEYNTGMNIGIEVSLDVARLGKHRVALAARAEGEISSVSYAAFTLGLGYRFF